MRNLHAGSNACPATVREATPGLGLPGTAAIHRPVARAATYQYPISYETAYRALGLATDAAAVNNILSIAAAIEARARACNDRSLELDAIELRFHAECRLDDMATKHKC